MACRTRVRDESKREHTKHILRLRHTGQILDKEASEIILLNSHDGSSSYQMMGGKFRFVCANFLFLYFPGITKGTRMYMSVLSLLSNVRVKGNEPMP